MGLLLVAVKAAPAGLDAEFSLPFLSVFLSVSSSCRGPEGVKIENADGAVATVTGLEVGTYEFTLTVTDERKLQSSDTVTVIVREGELRIMADEDDEDHIGCSHVLLQSVTPHGKAHYIMLVTVRLMIMFKVLYCTKTCRHLGVGDS